MDSQTAHLSGDWLYVADAARTLNLSEGALRQRLSRKEFLQRRGANGRVQVLVPTDTVMSPATDGRAMVPASSPEMTPAYWFREVRRRDVQIGRLLAENAILRQQNAALQQAVVVLAQQRQEPEQLEAPEEWPEQE